MPAKKPNVKAAKRVAPELRRWCIEMAMRWPVLQTTAYGNQGGYGATGTLITHTDADVIARAEKIRAWVEA